MTSARGPMLAALALGAALALLWLARSLDGPSAGGREGNSATRDEARAPRMPAPVDGARGREETREHAAGADEAPSASAPLDEALEPEETRAIEVVLAGSERAVPDAQVAWWSPPELAHAERVRRFERAFAKGDLDELLAEHALALRADSAGRALAPDDGSGGCAIASAPGLWGFAFTTPGDPGPLRVHLERDFDLAARVVDARGVPIEGVAVALRLRWDFEDHEDLRSVRTDADGRARLLHAGLTFVESAAAGAGLALGLGELLDPPVEVAIDPARPPTGTIELIAPEHGSCELLVVDADGQPWTESIDLWVELLPPANDEHRDAILVDRYGVEAGRAQLPLVTPGRELLAGFSGASARGGAEVRATGPAFAGQHVQMTLRVGAGLAEVRAHALSPEGAPLRSAELRVAVWSQDERAERQAATVRTDAEGRLALDLAPDEEPQGARALTIAWLDERGAELANASAALPAMLAPGPLELGELALRASPRIASGRVVDDAGAPIGGARVQLLREHFSRDDPTRSHWRWSETHHAATDAAGAFAIHAAREEGRVRLEARHGDARSEWVEAEPGAEVVVLTIAAPGALAGRVLLDPSFLPESIELVAELLGAAELRLFATTWHGYLDSTGEFRIGGLHPGRYSLRVESSGREELARIDEIDIAAGAATREQRLDPLDLSAWRALELRVVDEDGAPVPGSELAWRTEGDDDEWGYWTEGLPLRLVSDGRPLEVFAQAEGFLTQRATGVTESRTFVLARGPRLRFAPSPALPQLAPPLRFELLVEPLDEADSPAWLVLDEHGAFSWPAPQLGEHRATLLLVRESPDAYEELELTPPRAFELRAQPAEQTLELELAPETLAEALRELGG